MDATPPRPASRDTAAITAVKDGIAQAYGAIAAGLPSDVARARWQESHGVLRIVANSALIRLSEEVGNLLAHTRDAAVDPARLDGAINGAGKAILACLGDLAAGLPDRPMRLLPAYRALLQARGVEQVSPSELFYPDIGSEHPARPAAVMADVEALRAARRRFEAALLRWLRNAGDTGALDEICAAVTTVEASRATQKARAPWCAALAVIEGFRSGALSSNPELPRFIAKLNIQIGRVIDGSGEFPESLFRQALYFIALAPAAGGLAGELRRAYALDGILDAEDADAPLAPLIPEGLGRDLKRLNQAWSGWAAGETKTDALRAEIDAVEGAAIMLSARAPAELLAEIRTAMRAQADAGKPDPAAAVEISCALLIMEKLIDSPGTPESFARRAANARARLQACRSDRTALRHLPPMELLDAQARRDEAKLLLSQTLAQAETMIARVESVLEAFFADAGTRAALAGLDKPLAQCAGMFSMLQDEPAAVALGVCREEIGRLAAGRGDDAAIKDRLVRRLTALAAYVGASRQGYADLDALHARAGLGAADTALAPQTEKPIDLKSAALPADVAEALDHEMLEVFLEEARDVLANVETALPLSRQDPQNTEHLASLRRAFHTLKGSGRMVGLIHLGEAAWEIEQVFNRLVQDKLPGTPDLYRLIALAHESFARWVSELRTGGHAAVDAVMLADWARRVRAGEPLPVAEVEPAGEPAPGTQTARLKMLTVKIGAASISPVLYGIFIEEARQLILVLEGYGSRIANEPHVAAEADFLRAAHTLCGIAATVGFDEVSELASSLERTLLGAGPAGTSLNATARADMARAIERLSQMVARIAERQAPGADPALVEALNKAATPRRVDAVFTDPVYTGAPSDNFPGTEPASIARERRGKRLDDDIDEELLAVFLSEAQELLPQIGQDLRDWRARPLDMLVPQSLKRLLHTLKGSSRMAGAMALGELTHQMETRVENASRLAEVPESLYDELDGSYDRLNQLIDELQAMEREPGIRSQKLPAAIEALSDRMAAATLTGKFRAVGSVTSTQPTLTALSTQPTMRGLAFTGPATGMKRAAASSDEAAAPVAPAAAAQRAVLRIRAESAERLANQAGEVAIARARAESELRGVRGAMRELTDNIIRLRGQLREIEMQAEMQMQTRIAHSDETDVHFDPLEFDRFTRLQELTRLMAESVNDVATVQQNLMHNLDEGEAALGAQARTTRELQDELLRIRMVPFSSLSDRLYRVARLASKDVGKRVQLDIRGAQAELDRGVLDRIVAPLEHLLRNSIAHGIEPEGVRKSAGKPEAGEIVIEVRQEGSEVVIGIADDGAGLDVERIRARALSQGLMRGDESLSDAQIADFIFRSGFSTVESVSEVAGRGVGLDVVGNEISSLGGRIEIDFERGKGTRFTIYLSVTLTVLKAVVMRAGEELYTVPSLLVEQVQSLKPEPLAAAYDAHEIAWQGARYPLHYLGQLLGRGQVAPSQQRYSPVLLLRSGPHRAAIHVDQLLGGQEIVVKNIGPQLARVPGVTGAAVLASGDTVLILNPVPLAQRAMLAMVQPAAVQTAPVAAVQTAPVAAVLTDPIAAVLTDPVAAVQSSEPAAPRAASVPARQAAVLVVDDSLTVRKITGRALAREGYNVVVAKDGIEALEKMQSATPDVIITDVEMPRMDGFDLTRNVRADPRLKDLPVIMITSRTAEKHRKHASELGVNVFLGKPYEERELLEHIAGFVRAVA